MTIHIICFTKAGAMLAERIREKLTLKHHNIRIFVKMKHFSQIEEEKSIAMAEAVEESLSLWVEEAFQKAEGILFVGACGIAVRSIAPFIKDKYHDPAVLVIDEQGNYCISLLSGHVGGANQLCNEISKAVCAVPVITTATDINQKFAVDIFAVKNHLTIMDKVLAKEVSAAILAGEEIPMLCEKENDKDKYLGQGHSLGIYVGIHFDRSPFDRTLFLVPRTVAVGIGCRTGTQEKEIEALYQRSFWEAGIFTEAAKLVTSITLKQEEPGLLAFSSKWGLPMAFYEANELGEIKGEFHASEFVRQITGVDNVCERCACKGAGLLEKSERLLIEKQSENGVTIAAAEEEWGICYE